jgi:type IV pilus assembly protein PilC
MSGLTFEEQDRFVRELASLTRAGVPMPEGLSELSGMLEPGRLKVLTADLAEKVEQGKALSAAMLESTVEMPREFIALVQCGEISGEMCSVLEFAVEHSRRVKRHRSAMLTTLVYPTAVLIVTLLVAWFVSVMIVPKFKDIFDQIGAELPFITQGAVEISYVISHGFGGLIIAAVIVLIVAMAAVPAIRDRLFVALCILPGFRDLVAISDTSLFMKFIEKMAGRGVPLHAALGAASLAVWQRETRESLVAMSEAAKQGHRVGSLLSGRVPSTAAWLFCQAEERGDLPATCGGIADYCEDRFERLSKYAVAVLEPLLLVLVAAGIGYLVVSLYLPLFSIPKMIGAD